MTQAVLLIGHGTRDVGGVDECLSLMRAVEVRLQGNGLIVENAFLELVLPDIRQGLENCIARGAADITLVPLLLFAAGHWKRDIPAEVSAVMRQHAGIAMRSTEALGLDQQMVQLVVQRIMDAGYQASDSVLLVGRGNRDAEATKTFQAFAKQLRHQHHVQTLHTAVMTGIGNTVEDGLELCVASGSRRVILVPYILFRGKVFEELAERARAWQRAHPGVDVTAAPYLWPHDAVVDAFCRRIEARLPRS